LITGVWDNILMGVLNDDGQSNSPETRQVVDIISNERDLFERDFRLRGELLDSGKLIVATVDASDHEFAAPSLDDGICFRGNHDHQETELLKPTQSQTVTAHTSNGLSTIFKNENRVVCEHSVEIEGHETNIANALGQRRSVE
jgi:hypothetical protein